MTQKNNQNEPVVGNLVQSNMLEPLYGLMFNIVIGMVIVAIIILYRKHIGKPMSFEAIKFLQIIVFGLILLNFLRKFM